jgi:hypothetical protein
MKIIILIIGLAISACFVFSQDIVLPPELKWWIDETQKANPAIAINDFSLNFKDTIPYYVKTEKFKGNLYPVLMKWNYSGNQFAYYDLDMSLKKEKDGRYSVLRDIDSGLGVFDRNNNVVFIDGFGSSLGLNGISWTRDNQLVVVGLRVRGINSEKHVIDLIIREYTIKSENVERKEYLYKDAFDNDVRFGLRLNWWEQRPDYFSE